MFTRDRFLRLKRFGQIRTLSPEEFEWFGKFLLESLGYDNVTVTGNGDKGKDRGDGGIDLTGTFHGQKFYGECKRWKRGLNGTDILPIAIVRSLGGVMMRDGIKRGVVITTLRPDHSCISEGGRMGIGILGIDEIVTAMQKINPSFKGEKLTVLGKVWRTIANGIWFFVAGNPEKPKRKRRRS